MSRLAQARAHECLDRCDAVACPECTNCEHPECLAPHAAARPREAREPYASLRHPAGPCLMGCGLCAAY